MAFLLLLAFALLTSPIISTSHPSTHPTIPQSGFRTPLKHIDSGKNLTKSEILHHAIEQSNKRMQTLTDAINLSSSDIEFSIPVYPTPEPSKFYVELAIGTPPLNFSALLDTGSDLLWTQCQPCVKCFPQPTPIYDPKKSSSYIDLKCNGKPCPYFVGYGAGDRVYTSGFLANETFKFGNTVVGPKVAFGCGTNNTANFTGAGILGLGRGPFSIVQQFEETRFAYCLTSYTSNENGFLALGSLAKINNNSLSKITTPLLENPLSSKFYYISLEGITVGNTFLPINQPPGTEGTDNDPRNIVVDTGAPYSFLDTSLFQRVKTAFSSQTNLPVGVRRSYFELCFVPPFGGSPSFPKLIFHFKGADLVLPQENYIVPLKGQLCLALIKGSVAGFQIFGSYQTQNTFVLHDLEKKAMSFVPTQSCDQV